MADNFNLRAFLTENKLTKNAQLLKEEVSLNGKPVDIRSIEIDGIDTNDYPDFVDAYIIAADFEDGTPLTDDEVQQFQDENYDLVGELIHDRQLYLEGEKEEVPENPEDYTKQPGYVHETLTANEKRLVEMVQDALGVPRENYQNADPNVPNDSTDMAIDMMKNGLPEGDEMANETVIPEYKNIEELLKGIEEGTNKVAEEHKIQEMKKIAEALRMKAKKMEESEHAAHISPKDLKQLATDAAKLEKAAEKLKAAFDKKFNKKQKPASAPKAEKVEALQETTMENFDLKKFLVENKLTTNSRMINEELKFIDANDPARKKGGNENLKITDLQPGKTVIALNKHYSNREELEHEAGTFVEVDEEGYIRWKTKSGKEKVWKYIDDIAIVTNL